MKGLSDREAKFVLEYMLCLNGAEAARKTGLSKKAPAIAAHKMMNRPHVKKAIDTMMEKDRKDFEIQRNEILYNLWACATRDGRKFVNDRGELISPQEIKDLPDELGLAIDSIKQKVVRRWKEDEVEVDILETEIKLVPKATALDMAMKHKGLFELDNQQKEALSINFDQLIRDQRSTIDVDPIEERLRLEEQGSE